MYHFGLNEKVTELVEKEAFNLMLRITKQWDDESTDFGTLYLGVYDWAVENVAGSRQIKIPQLRTGGEIQLNRRASKFFGFDIFGDCFLAANTKGSQKISLL